MNKRKALGRGVASLLIPTHSESEENSGDEIQNVDINVIDRNPYQPRIDFNEEDIVGLAESIQNQGLLQPIVLRQKGIRYEIISGERRFRAFKYLKRDSLPCIVKSGVSDREMLELALVENIQREQLNEIEKALAYQNLIQEFDYTHEELAKQVGKSRTVITNSLRLLNLPKEIQQLVRQNDISSGHARAILSLPTVEKQMEAARRIVEDKLTVRDMENIAQQDKSTPKDLKPSASKSDTDRQLDPDMVSMLERLQYKFGTPVKLKTAGGDKGRVEIEFFGKDDLVRIFDLLLGGVSVDLVDMS